MRKRNVSFVFDKCLWFLILLLPLIFAFAFTISSMNNYTFSVTEDSIDSTSYVSSSSLTIDSRNYSYNDYDKFLTDNIITIYGSYNNTNGNYTDGLVIEFYNADNDSVILDVNQNPYKLYVYFLKRTNIAYNLYLETTSGGTSTTTGLYFGTFSFVAADNYVNTTISLSQKLMSYFSVFDWNPDVYQNVPSKMVISRGSSLPSGWTLGFQSKVTETVLVDSNIFNTYFNNLNGCLDSWFTFGDSDIVYTSFNSIFGTDGILPIFITDSFIPKYLTYMCWIYILHLIFDFLVFIPRLAHKWMGKVYNDEE